MLQLLKYIFRLFYPDYCPLCDRINSQHKSQICVRCISELPLSYSWHNNSSVLYKKIEGECIILHCATLMYFENDNVVRKILHKIKYDNKKELGYEFGRYFAVKLRETLKFENLDYIVPLPLHSKKEKQRGYNQSYWIAKGISEELGVELNDKCVRRIVNNPTQTSLSAAKRKLNVKDIFQVVDIDGLKDKTILLIDDVCTTGSTISSLVNEINTSVESCVVSIVSLATVK